MNAAESPKLPQSVKRQLDIVKKITEYQIAQAYQVVMDLELQLDDRQHSALIMAVMQNLATNFAATSRPPGAAA